MKDFSTLINNCPHFNACSGCTLKDIYDLSTWKEVVSFIKDANSELTPILYANDFKSSRSKAKLAVQKKEEEILIGLYKEFTHEVIDIPNCLLHHPSINIAITEIKKALKKFNLSIYDQKNKKGLVRYLQLFVQKNSGKVQVSFVLNTNEIKALGDLKDFFNYLLSQSKNIFHSIWINLNEKDSNAIFSDRWQLLFGEEYFWQKIKKVELPFHPMSFSQSNLELYERLIEKIEEEISFLELKRKNILELYAGNGSIGLNLAHRSNKMVLVESNPFSMIFFDKIALKKEFENIIFLNKEVRELENEIDESDIIIADPPRKGLDPEIIKKLLVKDAGYFIYISCNFKTFKRDTEILKPHWKIRKAHGFLFFPGTEHIEIMAVFEKNLGERI